MTIPNDEPVIWAEFVNYGSAHGWIRASTFDTSLHRYGKIRVAIEAQRLAQVPAEESSQSEMEIENMVEVSALEWERVSDYEEALRHIVEYPCTGGDACQPDTKTGEVEPSCPVCVAREVLDR